MSEDSKFLGQGWKFPPRFHNKTGETEMASGEDDIMQSIEILIGTNMGERLMNDTFGAGVSNLMFSNVSPSLEVLLEGTLKENLTRFESRIIVNSVQVDLVRFIDGVVTVTLDFTVRTTNNRRNVVYPFYLQEGNLVPKRLTAN